MLSTLRLCHIATLLLIRVQLHLQELSLKAESEKELKEQLKRQAEVHADYLEDVIELKNREMERQMKQNVNEKVEDMKINYNRQLARVIGRMKGLDVAMKGIYLLCCLLRNYPR